MEKIISQYLNKIKNYPVLTKEEEIYFGKLAAEGDLVAKQKLIESNLRLVLVVAKNFLWCNHMNYEDLVQEGNLGLIHAVEKYNPKIHSENKFSTYAVYWIRAYIQQAIRETGPIRFPANRYELINEYHYTSLETPVKNSEGEESSSIKNLLADESSNFEEKFVEESSKQLLIKAMSEGLSELEFFVINQRYGINSESESASLTELSLILGLSKEGVRQIQFRAEKKIFDLMKVWNFDQAA